MGAKTAGARGKYPQRAQPRPVAKALAGEPLRLLEAVVEHAAPATLEGAPLCVQLPGGGRVEVSNARQAALAAELLRALAVRPC